MANQAIIADGTLRLLRFGGTNPPVNMTANFAWEVRKPDGTVLDSGTAYGAGAAGKATYEGWSGAGFANPEFGNTATLAVAAGTPNGTGYELRQQNAFYGNVNNTALSAFFDVAAAAVSGLKGHAIVTDGDSISAGYRATDGTGTYGRQLFQLLGGFASDYDYLNTGEYGVTIASKITEGPQNNQGGWAARYPAANVTYLFECGTNDIAGGATNDATIYNNLVTYATGLLALTPGARLALRTLLPRQTTGGDAADVARKAVYDAVNARIRGKVGLPASTIILDDAALSQFAYPPSSTVIADGTHPNNAGYLLMAQNSLSAFTSLAAPASLTAAAPQASAVLTWPAAATATGYRVRRDGVTAPVYDGAGLTFTDTFTLGTSHTYTVTAYNTSGESALTAPVTATAITTSLSLTVTPGTGVNTLAWLSDPQAANGYAVLWMPGSALPVVGGTGEVVARVAQGTLTWADTSAYRIGLTAGSRYDVISLR